jgi:glycosyltransferase involved in cell wall biosynthesis
VIASDIAACREWVRDGTEGLLAAPGSSREWALAIRRLLRDEPLRQSLGEGARRRAEACFAWPVVQGQLTGEFLSTAGGGKR